MKNNLLIIGLTIILLANNSCNNPKDKKNGSNTSGEISGNGTSREEERRTISEFIPKGFVFSEEVYGDLDKDGLKDCIIIIKATNKANIIKDDNQKELDRNRRGILILLKKKSGYKLVTKNLKCFSSENEDGGVYFAPELSVNVEKGKLYIHYSHGRYGYWKYTFRFKNGDFELIGYDESSSNGPVVDSEISANFLSKKKQTKVNVNEDAESGEEKFEEKWEDINVTELIKLSTIENFDKLDVLNKRQSPE